jgi:hypothetical protein
MRTPWEVLHTLTALAFDPPTIVRAEGGAKHKRDALAVCSSK